MSEPPSVQPLATSAPVEHVFPTLTPAQVARIAAHGRVRPVEGGEVLVGPDEPNTRFFVVRAGHPSHGRILLASLTRQGRRALKQGRAIALAIEDRLLIDLTPGERSALMPLPPSSFAVASSSASCRSRRILWKSGLSSLRSWRTPNRPKKPASVANARLSPSQNG